MTLLRAFSSERLSKYQTWAGGEDSAAMRLYALNVTLSEAFYIPLHTLEITLRNQINDRMKELHGENWLNAQTVLTDEYQRTQVREAQQKLARGGQTPNNGQIVAELTFGFWTALLAPKNSQLWGKGLRPIFDAGRPLQRKDIAKRLNAARRLRNRFAALSQMTALAAKFDGIPRARPFPFRL